MPKIQREPDDRIKPELIDYETAMRIMADIENRAASSTPIVLAQWVALIRKNAKREKD